ncbi:hypothetical protein KsCSTR_17010 [Candidatus Kuenenia stuttgartiensis]|uniref:Uncharacterized protein n=1 Tax=Kuenenia stuttgartiensis TaxID=174633 RepID=Q1Q218_KUEST|nr:hypothetical protein KsCSTR_17010 [Candidatus Kuenenia stuttgartiensis]CAJ74049.1 unknown protein [Candidatus Kuenenia stuttgartiensis]
MYSIFRVSFFSLFAQTFSSGLLPMRRLLFKIARPPFVRILFLKPHILLRFIELFLILTFIIYLSLNQN